MLIIISAIFFFSFLVAMLTPLLFSGGIVDDPSQIVLGLIAFVVGVFAFVLGIFIKAHNKYAWYAGMATISIATLGNLFSIVSSFSLILWLALILDFFALYALVSERELF